MRSLKCLLGFHRWHRLSVEGAEMIECYRCQKRKDRGTTYRVSGFG